MRLRTLQQRFAVLRLDPESRIPDWVQGDFLSITKTPTELSIVVEEARLPTDWTMVERGWRVLSLVGPIDFSEVGVLLDLAAPLAAAGVSIFTISTYDTDHLLVREADLGVAIEALRAEGHDVVETGSAGGADGQEGMA